MSSAALRSDEWAGLAAAAVLHVALVALLLLQPEHRPLPPKEERMTVNLSTEVALEATAPEPVPESAARLAPELGEALPEAEPEPAVMPEPLPAPEPVATTPPKPKPVPKPTAKPRPKPSAKPSPKPSPKSSEKPKPKPSQTSTTPRRRPDTPSTTKPSTVASPKPTSKPGGNRKSVDDAFSGLGESTTSKETRLPASQIGASAKASIGQALARQIKPHWSAPQGADADLLVTVIAFDLNPDGSLAGKPRVVRQSGITDANKPQAQLHAERAIRAVQLAAPFDLPPEYYNAWKRITASQFDRNPSR